MYAAHYNLTRKPFQISPDPKFLWLGEKHKEALATLRYGTLKNYGFLLLTGDVGTGKTTLINALLNGLDKSVVAAAVPNPNLVVLEFFNFIANAFGIKDKFDNKFDFIRYFGGFLKETYDDGKRIILILDEAHRIPTEILEEIRLLSNIEKQHTKLLNIFFLGQDEIHAVLAREECRALRQRIAIRHSIEPLNLRETEEYISYRLQVAGSSERIFTKKAVRQIHSFSQGYPRLINIACDRALLTGYVKNLTKITPEIVRECAEELRLPGEGQQDTHQELPASTERMGKSIRRFAVCSCLLLLVVLFGYFLLSLQQQAHLGRRLPSNREPSGTIEGTVLRDRSKENMETTSGENKTGLPSLGRLSDKLAAPEAADEGEVVRNQNTARVSDAVPGNQRQLPWKDATLSVPFDYNTNEISTEARAELDKLIDVLLQHPEVTVLVKGHADTRATREYNRRVSRFRANVVKGYLIGKGIPQQRIQVIGRDETTPQYPDTGPEWRKAKRLIEIELAPVGNDEEGL